ncbi:MAG: DNA repair protein RecN [Alphaproteobacteria bacterium]|nr:DNA repair protein RecN [Alphaproteobacteria bacterium]
MLTALSIRNIVLIESLEIDFRAGLCALTGETGAGKSILLDSLGLALGARAESGLVRRGCDQAQVTAIFEPPPAHPVYKMLGEAELEAESGESLIIRRSLSADGRSKAYINDQPISAGLLKQIGAALVEIHGQFDTHGLLDASNHRRMLDEYAGLGGNVAAYYQEWKAAEDALESLKAQALKAKEDEEYLRRALEDLDALAPQAGEEETLAARRQSLMYREQVMDALNNAYNALNHDDDPVRSAWGALERVADKIGPAADDLIGALERASNEMQEAVSLIQSLCADLSESEDSLETIDERLHEIRTQARKHHCDPDALPQKREELAAQLNLIEHQDDLLAAQMKKAGALKEAYRAECEKLTQKRQSAAETLDQKITAELAPLKLEKAKFVTDIAPLPEEHWSAHGADQVRFLVSTNPGSPPGPLNKIASGGEMARFMLALKVVMAQVGSAPTLIFDEVDTGIGGATADAVGERLARLSQTHQIMVVTHSPQVAARAAHHWIVRKSGDQDVKTEITPLEADPARREEIARMLSGAHITEEARAAADKLLQVKAA